jgi:hypothetical protein
MGKGHFIYRRRRLTGLAERGIEAGASVAGSRALAYAKEGKFRKALMWSIPMAAAVLLVWYIRR